MTQDEARWITGRLLQHFGLGAWSRAVPSNIRECRGKGYAS